MLRFSEDEFLSGLSNFLVNKFYGEDYGLEDDEDEDGDGVGGIAPDELPPWRMGASPNQQQPHAVGALGSAQPPQEQGGIDADL